jgi:putative ABC transport system permease protein
MNEDRSLRGSERWFRLLLRFYPPDFREEMGDAFVETYRDRARAALRSGGRLSLVRVWLRALVDSLRNGPGERARPAVTWRRSGNWGRDIELATRRLVRAPLFATMMVGTLTVGLGAFAVVYAVVHKVLIEPLPYERPDDLYYVWRDYRAIFDLDRGWLGGTDVAELQGAGGVIAGAAGMLQQNRTLTGVEGTEPDQISVIVTSPGLFDLLGVRPSLGRAFHAEEVGPGRPPVIVLTHALWNRLGADRAIVGTDIRLDGQPFTVIGVMPRGFAFVRTASLGPPSPADAYIPLDLHLAETNPGNGSYAGLMRVHPGTPPEAVAAAVTAVARRIDERDFDGRGVKLYPVGLEEDLVADVRPALIVLGAAGVFLVLVLMVNLASLLLVRATQREQEFAVSRALGANQLAIVRATLFEGGLLGLLGGAGAALAAVWGTRTLVGLAPLDLPRREAIAVDWQIALVVVGIGGLLGFVAATAPALWAARTRLAVLLGSASVRGGGGRQRMRRSMVVVQVALSLVLLSAGGLVVRSFDRLLRADPGFEPAGVLTLRIPVSRLIYPSDTVVNALHARIEAELAALPGVTAVGATNTLPLSADANQTTISIPGAPGNTGDEERDRPLVDYMSVRPGYFEALGFRFIAGRTFTAAAADGVNEAIIDRTLADYFFPTGSPLGAIIPWGDDSVTVIGVVEQARLYDVHVDGRPQVYLRNDQLTFSSLNFTLRTQRPPLDLVPEVRAVIRRIDPQLALADVRSMDEVIGESLRQQRISAVLISGFSLGALLLAAMGLFGIVAGSVARRRHELAVRLALGADQRRVVRLVMQEGAALIALGLLAGVPGIYFAGGLVRGVLVGISPFDPPTLMAVALGLGAVALLACYIPARRVARIEPARSLRQER